jgi:hypothetical protein
MIHSCFTVDFFASWQQKNEISILFIQRIYVETMCQSHKISKKRFPKICHI